MTISKNSSTMSRSDWLSDEYGWCHFGFETETDDGGIIKCDTLPE